MVAPAIRLALVPEDLSTVEAAPSMCAGITTYNALRNSSADVLFGLIGLSKSEPSGDDGHLKRSRFQRSLPSMVRPRFPSQMCTNREGCANILSRELTRS